MTKTQTPTKEATMNSKPVGMRSGADARTHGMVNEYAEAMKKDLISMGQSEQQAEAVRLQIIAKFGTKSR
jgi:hypothetical protein